jgi:hypothetical protein
VQSLSIAARSRSSSIGRRKSERKAICEMVLVTVPMRVAKFKNDEMAFDWPLCRRAN